MCGIAHLIDIGSARYRGEARTDSQPPLRQQHGRTCRFRCILLAYCLLGFADMQRSWISVCRCGRPNASRHSFRIQLIVDPALNCPLQVDRLHVRKNDAPRPLEFSKGKRVLFVEMDRVRTSISYESYSYSVCLPKRHVVPSWLEEAGRAEVLAAWPRNRL